MRKHALLVIMMALIFVSVVGCSTTDCRKCPPIIKVETISPEIKCNQPESFKVFQQTLLSPEDAKTEGQLLEILTVNIKKMELQIKLWQIYRDCVDEIVSGFKK